MSELSEHVFSQAKTFDAESCWVLTLRFGRRGWTAWGRHRLKRRLSLACRCLYNSPQCLQVATYSDMMKLKRKYMQYEKQNKRVKIIHMVKYTRTTVWRMWLNQNSSFSSSYINLHSIPWPCMTAALLYFKVEAINANPQAASVENQSQIIWELKQSKSQCNPINSPWRWQKRAMGHSRTELGTFGIFNFFNNKKWFFCIFYQVNNLFLYQSDLKSPLPVKLTRWKRQKFIFY